MLGRLTLVAVTAFALASCDGSSVREIRVVGSSTVFPFTTAVAEAFVNQGKGHKAPVIQSTGTGAGFKRFCEGVGAQFPDVVDASRAMKRSEYDNCRKNGVGEILEIQIGTDGIALAESNNGPKMALTEKDIYLALAANPMGKPNTAKTWKDVNPALPAIPITVYGPPSTSGTRDAFAELILQPGCLAAWPEARALKEGGDPARFDAACLRLRDDGPYVDKGENDNLIVQGLAQNPNALGIFGYSYLEENHDRLHGVKINGIEPTYETIATTRYPGSRPLYLYVKKRHLKAVPGLKDFLNLYTELWDPKGELVKHGLIAAPATVRNKSWDIIQNEVALDPAQLH
ncbi:PstS family phosphate ABC transporter substrate-binding protein [Sphingomonas sp.]|uniref:PstS family phosphate ABC transporter substrate-binding protein n=1 Tax=Sphingomonas sp. TaxID=28214 RepID=UPI001B1F2427|nr:PstS family phosphate ABC transporter substrate-binding protein [Sphingomonas sp.]MBO9712699.1 PstS family phosphate ABC transporter substrate-binding protein [Sphingomonas sp.]